MPLLVLGYLTFGATLVWSYTMLATGPCPLLRWAHAHLSAGPPYLWSYISLELHSPAGALPFPRRGGGRVVEVGARPMVQNKSAQEIPPKFQAQNYTLYEILCLNLCVFTPLCRFAFMRLCL